MSDITSFLNKLGLGQYSQAFIDSDIDLELVNRLSESHLKELGLSLGHRLVLMDALATHNTPADANALSATIEPTRHHEPEADLFSAQGERRQLSVMFVDLVGSTALSEQFDPEDFSDIVRSYQKVCTEVIAQYNATIAKYSGDGILIYFGYPTARENDVERSLRAGLQLIESFRHREIRPGLIVQIRIGVATGLVVVGETIGENSSEEQVVLGETPNLAARLQSLAKPNELVVSHKSKQLVEEVFDFTNLGEPTLKGFSTAQQCWRVNSIIKFPERHSLPTSTESIRLLGRKEELDLLTNRWSRTCQSESQTVLLSGEAGIGKSKMVEALSDYLNTNIEHRGARKLYHFCSDYHHNTFLHPVIEHWMQNTNFLQLKSHQEKLNSLRREMATSQTWEENDIFLIAELLSIPIDADTGFSALTQQFKQSRTMEVLAEYYTNLAKSGPVLLVIEDVHWADPSTLDLLTRIKNNSAHLPLMLLLTYRSDTPLKWENHTNVTQLSLSRLPKSISADLVREIGQSHLVDDDLLTNIIDRADGIPLFIEELTKTVLEYSNNETDDRSGNPATPVYFPATEIPASLQDSLLARLDKQASARRIAQIGSAFGKEFKYEHIKSLIDINEISLQEKLDELVQAELLQPPTGYGVNVSYRFKHSLVRDAAYESMLKSIRRQLHRRIAESFQNNESIREHSPEIIAEHWERALNYTNATNYWLIAGQRSKERFALTEAISQLTRAVNIAKKTECQTDENISNIAAKSIALIGDISGLHGDGIGANAQYDKALNFSRDADISQWIQNKKHIPKTTRRAGATIAYEEHGSGSETIVLASAMIYGLGTLQPAFEELSQEYRVITIHTRGCGSSDPVVRPYPISEHAEDLAAIIRSACDKPVIAVGLSRAANTIIRMNMQHEGLVSKLITVGCPCKTEFGQGGPSLDPEKIERHRKAIRNQDIDTLVELLNMRILTEPGTEELRRKSIELRRQLPTETILSFFDPDPLMDITDVLPDVNIPVQIIHGAEDKQVVADSAHLMHELIPNSQLHFIKHAGHIPMITATQEFCNLVKQFIKDEYIGTTQST